MTDMTPLSLITIRHETPQDDEQIEALGAAAFGPGRYSRAAFRLREGVSSEPALSFVAMLNGVLVGSVKLTRIFIGEKEALVLGPLMVDPQYRKLGVGRELMNRSLFAARRNCHRYVVLVGDLAYYRPFGFERIEPGRITFPGPADPLRILGCELVDGAAADYAGQTRRYVP